MAIDEALIQRVTHTIVAHFHPRRIVLFGSHARGAVGPDSDLDLFIEMDTPNRIHTAGDISELFGLRDWGMDIVIFTPQEVAFYTGKVGTILYDAEIEGRVLYECPDYAPAVPSLA